MTVTEMQLLPRVLIADDQADVRLALQLLLKGQGYRTQTAESPAAVLEALERGGFEVLLMDLTTPATRRRGPRVSTCSPGCAPSIRPCASW